MLDKIEKFGKKKRMIHERIQLHSTLRWSFANLPVGRGREILLQETPKCRRN
jgi:hypothetical protein